MARQAVLELIADASKLRAGLGDAETATGKLDTKMGKLGGVIAGALSGAAVLAFGKSAVTAFTESEQAQGKLELALKNSAATVGVHAADFAKLNTELAKHTLADDDVIAATEARMVTFGASKTQIEQMIPTVLDFAAKIGVDAPAAADLFDKASLGSVKALKTLGIEGFKPTGDKAKDLASIQDLLKDKVKGAAKAQLDAAGPGATMKKSMDELQETVGKYLVPALSKIAEIGVAVMDFFAGHPVIMAFVAAIGALAAGVWVVNAATALFATEGAIATAAASVWAAAQWVLNAALSANPIGLVIAAVVALVAILVVAYKNVGWFRDIVDAVFGWIGGFVSGAFDTIKSAITGVFNWVKENWPLLLAILTGPIGLAVLAITTHWDTIKNAFTAVKNWIGDRVDDIVTFFTALPGRLLGAAGDLFGFVRTKVNAARDWVWERLGDIVGYFTGMPARVAAASVGLFDGLRDAFKAAINWIIEKWNGIRFKMGGQEINLGLFHQTIPEVTLRVPSIPLLAAGGIVTRPTLAVLGEAGAEAVIPLSRMGAAGGTSIVIHNHNDITLSTLDPAAAAPLVVAAIREYELRNGANWRTG